MLECYLTAICQASSNDAGTNNMSLFNLTEEIQRLPFVPHELIALEVHSYFRTDAAGLGSEKLSHDDVMRAAEAAGESFCKLVTEYVRQL